MSAGGCVLCGRPCRIRHHVTQADVDGELEVDVCHSHHQLLHDDWHTLGVGAEQPPTNFLDRLYLRLRRLAGFLGRLVEAGWGGEFIRLLATAVGAWATGLGRRIRLLDRHCPTWRTVAGMNE